MVEGVALSKPWLDYLSSLNPQSSLNPLNPQSALNPQSSLNPQNSPNPTYTYKMQLYRELVQVNEKLSKLPKRLSDWKDDAPQLIMAMNYFDPPQHIFHGVVSLLVQRVLISLELVNLMKQNVSSASSHPKLDVSSAFSHPKLDVSSAFSHPKLDVSSAFSHPEKGDYGMEDWVKNARVPVRDIVDFVKRKCPEESSMHFVESLLQELKAKDYGLNLSDIEEACKLPKPTLQPSTIHVENVEKVIGTLAGDVAKQEISQ